MKVFNYELVKDPTYFNDNRVEAHSDHRYFAVWKRWSRMWKIIVSA